MKNCKLRGKVVPCYDTKTEKEEFMIFIQKGKGLPYKMGLAIEGKPYIVSTRAEANKECKRFNEEQE